MCVLNGLIRYLMVFDFSVCCMVCVLLVVEMRIVFMLELWVKVILLLLGRKMLVMSRFGCEECRLLCVLM